MKEVLWTQVRQEIVVNKGAKLRRKIFSSLAIQVNLGAKYLTL